MIVYKLDYITHHNIVKTILYCATGSYIYLETYRYIYILIYKNICVAIYECQSINI